MITLTGSVGMSASNHRNDVIAIQEALSRVPAAQGGRMPALRADGIAGAKTKSAIFHFQQHHFRWADGRVSVRGPTLRAINHILTPTAPPAGVRPLASTEIRGGHDAPTVPAPPSRAGVVATAMLMGGECWFWHNAGRTRMVAGHPHPLVAGDRVSNSEGGRCKLTFLEGSIAEIGPRETLVIIHGDSVERRRDEGSPAVVRPGASLGRLHELSGR